MSDEIEDQEAMAAMRSEICHLQSSVLSNQERQERLRVKLGALQEENQARTVELESMQEDLEYHRRRTQVPHPLVC